MRYYRKPIHREGWYVTLEWLQTPARPSDYRWELGDWVSAWIRGTLPAQTSGEGGAA